MPPVSAKPGPRVTSLGPLAQSQLRIPASFWCTRTAQKAHSYLCKVPLVVINHSLSPWTSNSCLLLLSSHHHKTSPVCPLSSAAVFDTQTQIPKPSPRSLHTPSEDPSALAPHSLSSSRAWISPVHLLASHHKMQQKELKSVSSISSYSQWDC